KALDTAGHHHIFQVLGQKGVDKHIIDIIRDLYTNCGTTVEVQNQRTREIKSLGGVKQGEPPSPILFTRALDPLFCNLEKKGLGIKCGEQLVTSLAFVNDLLLLSDSWDCMEHNIEVLEYFC
ncbi:POLR protein, partial [Eudromia elegans]|nr:POLR protein [Eudromia elegans]